VALLADAPAFPRALLPHGPSPSEVRALARAIVREATAVRLGIATAAILVSGTLLSILTTPDPLWWQLHFSRLGTFSVFSGHAFNGALIATGTGVVFFGMRLRTEMARHAGTAVLTSTRSATVVPILVVVTGIHLSFVGIIPQNANEFLHDRASTGAVLTFFVILIVSRWMLRGMHRRMRRATRRVAVGWTISVSLFVPGVINMALFELIGFALIFGWLLLFARTLGRPDEAPAAPRTPARADVRDAPVRRPSGTTHATAPIPHPVLQNGRRSTGPWSARPVRRRVTQMRGARGAEPEHLRAGALSDRR
jgi:hypothetical membrane protein